MNRSNYITLIFCILLSSSCSSQKSAYTVNEKNSIRVFTEFTKYIHNCIHNKIDINDSAAFNYILLNFLFINSKADTTNKQDMKLMTLTNEQLVILTQEINTFYRFFQERENERTIENITAVPIRLSIDTFIYNKLTSFQKANTYAFYDQRYPKQTIGYILFLPPTKNITSTPKIWSWTLIYKFGKFVYRSLTGEEGYEYLFSPEPNYNQVPKMDNIQ